MDESAFLRQRNRAANRLFDHTLFVFSFAFVCDTHGTAIIHILCPATHVNAVEISDKAHCLVRGRLRIRFLCFLSPPSRKFPRDVPFPIMKISPITVTVSVAVTTYFTVIVEEDYVFFYSHVIYYYLLFLSIAPFLSRSHVFKRFLHKARRLF